MRTLLRAPQARLNLLVHRRSPLEAGRTMPSPDCPGEPGRVSEEPQCHEGKVEGAIQGPRSPLTKESVRQIARLPRPPS